MVGACMHVGDGATLLLVVCLSRLCWHAHAVPVMRGTSVAPRASLASVRREFGALVCYGG